MCAHNGRGCGIGCEAVRTLLYVYKGDVCEEIEISPPILLEILNSVAAQN